MDSACFGIKIERQGKESAGGVINEKQRTVISMDWEVSVVFMCGGKIGRVFDLSSRNPGSNCHSIPETA